MFPTRLLVLCIALALFVVSGCESSQAKVEKVVFYENVDAGLKIYESSNWILDSEVSSKPFNAIFKQDNVRVIVSIVPSVKSLDQIKKELNLDRDYVQLIEETADSISFQLNEKESIRSDIYLESKIDETLVLTFFTPVEGYEANQEIMEEFKNQIELTY
ncbi:hypothetical protein ACFFHM_17105 [Halalkalibacter kiskunsagensis]|uniref:PsbP C-terminal domain-containing protein n=1 Tax=Halalkalibacter kiskunsagensis TaxID=1548599 RepID=A0ABV6KFU8_9BACI